MAASDNAQESPVRLDVGAVINETFALIGRQFTPFMTAALLLGALPSFIGGLGALLAHASPLFAPVSLAGALVSLAGAVLLQGVLIYAATREMDGAPVDLTECLNLAAKAWLPLVGLSLVSIICIALGMILFIAPGFMIAAAWAVSAPVLVMEGRSIRDSISRSLALTRGRRWGIFLLVLLLAIAGLVLNTPLLSGHGHKGVFGQLIVDPLATMAFGLIDGVGVAVLYRRLVNTTP